MEEIFSSLGKGLDYILSWTFHFSATVSFFLLILCVLDPEYRKNWPILAMSLSGNMQVVKMNDGHRLKD